MALPAVLRAQEVRGRVLERDSQQPVAGAIVSMVADSTRLWPVLTDSAGSFRLRAAAAGSYRLRVDRVGFLPYTSDVPVVVAAGAEIERTLLVPSARAQLETVRITADGACRAPGIRGADAARVWEQVRTALRAAVLSSEQALVPLEMTVEQTMRTTPLGQRLGVRGELFPTAAVRTSAARAFVSPRGHDFRTGGFRLATGDSVEFFGPDADVALSEDFIATHCFRVVRGGGLFRRGQRVGLAFAPLDTTRATFLRGTMWLDEASSRLDELVYDYVVPFWPAGVQLPSGRIAFTPLRSGAWIVRDWTLKLPVLAVRPGDAPGAVGSDARHMGTYEKRGRTRELLATRDSTTAPAVVLGVVTDGLTDEPAQPLALAAWGAPAGMTDAAGRFGVQLKGLPRDGATVPLAVADPLVRAYLGDSAERLMLFKPGDTVNVRFTTPSADALVDRWCPDALSPAPDSARGTDRLGALLVGVTRAAGDTTTLRVRAEWGWRDARNNPQATAMAAVSAGNGVYLVCPVAVDRRVAVVISDATKERYRRLLQQAPRRAWGVRAVVPGVEAPEP